MFSNDEANKLCKYKVYGIYVSLAKLLYSIQNLKLPKPFHSHAQI